MPQECQNVGRKGRLVRVARNPHDALRQRSARTAVKRRREQGWGENHLPPAADQPHRGCAVAVAKAFVSRHSLDAMKLLPAATVPCLFALLAPVASGAVSTGSPFYGDPPDQTHPWAIHDQNRPQPKRVEPGTAERKLDFQGDRIREGFIRYDQLATRFRNTIRIAIRSG